MLRPLYSLPTIDPTWNPTKLFSRFWRHRFFCLNDSPRQIWKVDILVTITSFSRVRASCNLLNDVIPSWYSLRKVIVDRERSPFVFCNRKAFVSVSHRFHHTGQLFLLFLENQFFSYNVVSSSSGPRHSRYTRLIPEGYYLFIVNFIFHFSWQRKKWLCKMQLVTGFYSNGFFVSKSTSIYSDWHGKTLSGMAKTTTPSIFQTQKACYIDCNGLVEQQGT
jgi:hypothetical protein